MSLNDSLSIRIPMALQPVESDESRALARQKDEAVAVAPLPVEHRQALGILPTLSWWNQRGLTPHMTWFLGIHGVLSVGIGLATMSPVLTGVLSLALQIASLGVLERWIRGELYRRATAQ